MKVIKIVLFQVEEMKIMYLPHFRFEEKESVSGVQQLKSSVQKGIRTKLLEQYPYLESYVDSVIPKKDTYRIVKWLVF